MNILQLVHPIETTNVGDYSSIADTLIGIGIVFFLICFLLGVFSIICIWIMYNKANKPGWGSIVPFYNLYLLFDIAFANGWLFLLTFIPIINIIIAIILCFKLAEAYGHGVGFGFGILFFPVIFYAILAFGNSKYQGTKKEA